MVPASVTIEETGKVRNNTGHRTQKCSYTFPLGHKAVHVWKASMYCKINVSIITIYIYFCSDIFIYLVFSEYFLSLS